MVHPVTPEVANEVLFHLGYGGYPPGGFIDALLKAWGRADPRNHRRLAAAFPEYAGAVELAQQPGGIDQLSVLAQGRLEGDDR